ncbi:hypothetical protein DM02DRAFT_613874 [Periconia macrospinosa]|uniref:Uncharacterized protein n=1 Tax=Periconia macrospinosa TaxID=97972 RepID=A0A2V1DS65_9PLEO|nr:hypothetical protein DM02DRAFT_613874 [Periconia macrospinosa]
MGKGNTPLILSGWESIDRTEAQKKFDLALSTFRASFKERLEHTPTILTSMPFNPAIIAWAREILRSHECSTGLSQLISEIDTPGASHQICSWPFVKKLTVHLKSVILSKGLIIDEVTCRNASTLASLMALLYS